MKPSIGRIVHYVDPVSEKHFPAVIVEVEDTIYLKVWGRKDFHATCELTEDTSYATGTWHWPEREY